MASVSVKIANGLFVDYEGRYYDSLSPEAFMGNGWAGHVNQDGSIHLEASRNYSDGVHSITQDIQPNGRFVTRMNGDVIKKGTYKLTDGKLNGEFRLPGGNIDNRYIAYRDIEFSTFLEEHGITAVVHQDPNQGYDQRKAYYGGGRAESAIFTNGEIKYGEWDDERDEDWQMGRNGTNPNLTKGESYDTVKNASWAIVCQSQNERDNHNYSVLLYTKDDPMVIKDLPYVTTNSDGRFIAKADPETKISVKDRIADNLAQLQIFEDATNHESVILTDMQELRYTAAGQAIWDQNESVLIGEKYEGHYSLSMTSPNYDCMFMTQESYDKFRDIVSRNKNEIQRQIKGLKTVIDAIKDPESILYNYNNDNISPEEAYIKIDQLNDAIESIPFKERISYVPLKDDYNEVTRSCDLQIRYATGWVNCTSSKTYKNQEGIHEYDSEKMMAECKELEDLYKKKTELLANLEKTGIEWMNCDRAIFSSREAAERFIDNGGRTGWEELDNLLKEDEIFKKVSDAIEMNVKNAEQKISREITPTETSRGNINDVRNEDEIYIPPEVLTAIIIEEETAANSVIEQETNSLEEEEPDNDIKGIDLTDEDR